MIGSPPKCGRQGCDNYVGTNKNGYNLQCDECLGLVRHRTNVPYGVPYRSEFRSIDRSVPCWCGAEVGQNCVSRFGTDMNGVHKQRKLEANGLWTPGREEP